MYQDFQIKKQSGTYAETLEAFGVANLISEIFSNLGTQGVKITIEDNGTHYSVRSNKSITDEILEKVRYFLILKFIKKDTNQVIPEGVLLSQCFDYPTQKARLDIYKNHYIEIDKNKALNAEQKSKAKKELAAEKLSEFGVKLDAEYEVYREIVGKPYSSFIKLFQNFHNNQENFGTLIREILNYYSNEESPKREFKLIDEKPNGLQLYNPSQSKGLNKSKANNASMGSIKSFWIPETMKLSGALSFMVCQLVKVGSKYDLKIFVPEFNDISLKEAKDVIFIFKKTLKSKTPIKLDIINILDFSEKFIKETPEYKKGKKKGKIKNTIKGFHSVYQKHLGNARGVTNISFLQTPDFIEFQTKEQGLECIEILNQQKDLISNIIELGDSIQGLQAYRSFLGSIGNTALNYFSKFSYWYSSYVMHQLTKGNKYVRTFKIEHLNKFYNNMEPKLSEIINNQGFKSVAKAIRKSTVSLQYTPKEQRKFEIRYGLAQQLQNKSKSKADLAIFIGEFIGTYNAETGRNAEKNGGKAIRSNVKDDELVQFYEILDNHPARLVGALLASYGFALTSKEKVDDLEENDESEENSNEQ
jgi:hypothetical protein